MREAARRRKRGRCASQLGLNKELCTQMHPLCIPLTPTQQPKPLFALASHIHMEHPANTHDTQLYQDTQVGTNCMPPALLLPPPLTPHSFQRWLTAMQALQCRQPDFTRYSGLEQIAAPPLCRPLRPHHYFPPHTSPHMQSDRKCKGVAAENTQDNSRAADVDNNPGLAALSLHLLQATLVPEVFSDLNKQLHNQCTTPSVVHLRHM
jgi:hypothetical protein